MSDVTVEQFAEVLKVPVDKLLAQLEKAGIRSLGPKDRISEDAKHELLTHLRKAHGKAEDGGAPRKITLRRKAQSEIKVAAPMGKARTVNVEVRRQRTYIKRDVLEEQARGRAGSARSAARSRERRESGRRAAGTPRGGAARPAAPGARGIRAPHGRGNTKRQAEEQARRDAEQKARELAEKERRAREEKSRKTAEDDKNTEVRPPGTAHRRRAVGTAQEGPLAAGAAAACRCGRQRTASMGSSCRPSRCSAEVAIGETITVAELAQRMAVKSSEVMKTMLNMGVMATINQPVDQDTAVLVGRGNGPHRQGAEGRPGRGSAAGRHGGYPTKRCRARRS